MHSGFTKVLWLMECLLVAALLVCSPSIQADQAQYFYDELGRLVGVVDGQGSMAVYNYDAVGNLLSIERFASTGTGGTQIGVFLLTPSSALVGTAVQIRGFGFSATPSENQVAFNGRPASVLFSTTNSIMTVVPLGATSGLVTVTNANGTATSPQAFSVLMPPQILGIEPARIGQGMALVMAITGTGLANTTEVRFSDPGLSAAVLAGVTAQRVPINVSTTPSVSPGSYAFSVTTPIGVAQSGTITITVTPPVPSFSIGKLSVFFPSPGRGPTGPTMTVAPPLSVSMP